MPIETFWTFAALLLAGRKIAIATGAAEYAETLAELMENGNSLKAALRESGLAPLAREMERKATEARAFTHRGPARDDAEAIFWQVAPVALADRNALAAADLDPRAACDRMVAAIKASELGRDFGSLSINEQYFRAVVVPLLETMIADADYMTSLTPTLWRETLRRLHVQVNSLERIEAKTDHTQNLVLSQTQEKLEEARRGATNETLTAFSMLTTEMQISGVGPSELRSLLRDMQYNSLSITDVIVLVRNSVK